MWKDIKGFEGSYQVNALGSVRHKTKTGVWRTIKPIIRKDGRLVIKLYDINTKNHTTKLVSHIVLEAYVENPKNYSCAKHIDGDKQNCCVNNLTWCPHISSSPVMQLTTDGMLIEIYESMQHAYKATGIFPSNICYVCKNKRSTAGGFIWRYV